jgi:carboxyl-terminal processing protease
VKKPNLLLAVLLPIVLVMGLWIGAHPGSLPSPVRDALGYDEPSRSIDDAVEVVHDRYYREIPESVLADKAIAGMVDSLGDQFSHYFNPKQYKRFLEQQDSRFSGVGLAVTGHPRGLRVRDVYDDSPAERAGIKPGDLIIGADRKALKGLKEDAAVDKIRGEPGTDVTLVTERDGDKKTIEVTRATINLPSVASRRVKVGDKEVGVISLAQFTNGAHAEVAGAVKKEIAKGADAIVFDLRGNPGGLVNEAQLVTSVFQEDGVVVTTKGRNTPTTVLKAEGDAIAPKIPMVVLVDKDSASAAEIVAGALQDNKRAKLIGRQTFGKGVFQEVLTLPNGGALDITAGQYFTPSGRNLGGTGVKTGDGLTPDIKVVDRAATKGDEQLNRALDELKRELSQ